MLSSLLLASALNYAVSEVNPDSTPGKNIPLQEVVITDFKQNKKSLTPTAASSINARQLQNQQIVSLKELTAIMPNFFMPDYGSRANTPVFIRGIGTKARGTAVGFYVDGVPHYESSAFDIDLSDIASVEVLRGPQGTLYGRNAIAGIINVYTHNPLEYQRTHFKVGYGKFNDFTAQGSIYNKVGENLGIAASAAYHHNDGMFKNSFLNKKADKMNEGEGRLSLYWQPSDQWLFHINSTLAYSDEGGYPYAPFNIETQLSDPISYNRPSTFRRLISSTGLNARYENDQLSFNSQTSYQFIKSHQGIDQDFTPADLYFVTNDIHQNMLSQEFTLKSNNKGRFQWITGVFGMLLHSNQFTDIQNLKAQAATPTTATYPTAAFALYHQSSYNFWKGLSATIGLRFDYEHAKLNYALDLRNLNTEVLTHRKDFESKANFRQFTPKFTLQYLTNKHNLFYASVTRGYKPGGFNTSFNRDEDRAYNPEYSWNYEVGTHLSFLDGRLRAEADLFYIDWRDMQITYTIPGVGNLLTNAGHTNSKGAELSLTYRPIKALDLSVNYGYTLAKFLDYHKSEKEDFTHNRVPLVPNHTLGINATYTLLSAGWFDRIVFNTGLNGVGRIYWGEDNLAKQNFYAMLNAKISLTKGCLTWELWGKNLTNTHYVAYAFRSSNGYYAQRGKQLSFGTSLAVNF